MAKTTLERLQDAIAKGDMPAAAKLAEKLKKEAGSEGKAKKPSHPLTPAPAPAPTPQILIPGRNNNMANSEWMAPTRSAAPSGTKVGPDGRVLREAGRRSMAGEAHVNKWRDNGRTEKNISEIDKQNADREIVERRPPIQKVIVHCDGCNRPFELWPSEIMTRHTDDSPPRLEMFYKCDRCISKGR